MNIAPTQSYNSNPAFGLGLSTGKGYPNIKKPLHLLNCRLQSPEEAAIQIERVKGGLVGLMQDLNPASYSGKPVDASQSHPAAAEVLRALIKAYEAAEQALKN